VWFEIGVASGAVTLLALAEHAVAARNDGLTRKRLIAFATTTVGALIAIALILLTALHGVHNLRWWTFGLPSAMVGTSLLASTIHELTSERVRHELEVAQARRHQRADHSTLQLTLRFSASHEGRLQSAPRWIARTSQDLSPLDIPPGGNADLWLSARPAAVGGASADYADHRLAHHLPRDTPDGKPELQKALTHTRSGEGEHGYSVRPSRGDPRRG
jgi:hypothetical protein